MFINARPRIVSQGFETSVPIQRVESLHQRLVEMTENDVNGWSFFRPVATLNNGWDENIDDFNNENFALHSLYAGCYQDPSSVDQPQPSNLTKTSLYAAGHQVQCNTQKTTSNSHLMYQGQTTGMNCVEKRGPMLANGYSHCYLGQRHGSFAEFSNTKNGMKEFINQNSKESELTPFASVVSSAQQPSYLEDVPMTTDFSVDLTTSPSTAYSGYLSTGVTVDPIFLMSASGPNYQVGLGRIPWWPESSQSNKSQYQETYGTTLIHDGLPKAQNYRQPQSSALWNIGSGSSIDWTTQSTAPITISPKALTLNTPAVPFSSSGSSQDVLLSWSDSSSASSSREDTPGSGTETLSVTASQVPTRQHRQILPDSRPRSPILPVLPSSNFTSRKTTQKQSLKSKSESHSSRRPSPPYSNKRVLAPSFSQTSDVVTTKSVAPKRIEPKPVNQTSWSDSSQTLATAQATHHRDAKDDFLVKSKLAGMSYKDIRRQGDFVEAESTLRGRFRTLTKNKAARVRKPEWTDNDILLLKKSVRKLNNGSDPSKSKIPWKQVAEYIANNGGSYHFGNATCRKRWDELQAKQKG